MPEGNDTVTPAEKPVATETEPSKVTGTAVDEPTQDPAANEVTDQVDKTALEQLQKELNQAKQELNLRRNKEKELEAKRLEESGEYKELADKYKQELDDRTAKDEEIQRQKEAEDFRNKILSEYPQEVREAANELGLYWDNPENLEDAEAQLKEKVDKLASRISANPNKNDEPAPEVHANNPAPHDPPNPDRQKLIEEATKSRDFSKLLKGMPSVQAQIKRMRGED